MQMASGLGAAHDRGVVHRDLKPENVIVTPDGRLKILDFGLAKTLMTGSASSPAGETMMSPTETQAGTVLGTVGYMAPEQVRGEAAIDQRADLFALGAILHEMLSGRRAFQGASAVETMNAILREDPPDLGREAGDIPPALARVVQRCLEKSPAERFQSARDLGFHLSALGGESGLRSGASAAVGARPKSSRGLMLAAVALVGAMAGLALGWALLRQPPVEPVRFETFTYSGSDDSPAVSPDGKTIAFSSSRNGKRQIWLKQIARRRDRAHAGTRRQQSALLARWHLAAVPAERGRTSQPVPHGGARRRRATGPERRGGGGLVAGRRRDRLCCRLGARRAGRWHRSG